MSEESQPREAPRVFMSYSHDDAEHSDWVLALASRLRSNGVDVCLDRWDVTLGGNLSRFMERAASDFYRVVAVISEKYARKADEREGGAGIEAQMLSARLYDDLDSAQVIPVIRNNPAHPVLLPAFLKGRRWIDFRDKATAEDSYETLLRDLHQAPVEVAPLLGTNPFEGKSDTEATLEIRNSPSRWHSPGLTGDIEFVYTQNSGRYSVGSGECRFTLDVSTQGTNSVYALRDPSDIRHVAVLEKLSGRDELLSDVSQFDTSSRHVDVAVGDAIILHNQHGYWAVAYITEIFMRQDLNRERVMRFRYVIQSDRTADLSSTASFLLDPQNSSAGT